MTESEKMSWDLSQLVEFEDPFYIEERLSAVVKAWNDFRDKHRGKITTYNIQQVLAMIEEMQGIAIEYDGAILYPRIAYAADMNQEISKRLYDKVRDADSRGRQARAFMSLELGKLIEETPAIVDDPILVEYKHMMEKLQRSIPHMLSEAEEQLIIAKDKNGVQAWSILQGDWLASRTYEIEIDGEMKTLPYGEIVGLYSHPDRDLRKRVH
ncbi:MAG: hypothetical protein ACFFE7_15125, partial [Candidatus Thorarchaeota archaeon]